MRSSLDKNSKAMMFPCIPSIVKRKSTAFMRHDFFWLSVWKRWMMRIIILRNGNESCDVTPQGQPARIANDSFFSFYRWISSVECGNTIVCWNWNRITNHWFHPISNWNILLIRSASRISVLLQFMFFSICCRTLAVGLFFSLMNQFRALDVGCLRICFATLRF